MESELHGILVVDKPAGMTSAAVVARVKRALGVKRVGHTGTLDPMATGVLPLCVGEGTKTAGYLLAEDKRYEASLRLGIETDTLDADGDVVTERPGAAARVTEAALRDAMARLVGDIEQVPPMYSAIKHRGQRLHALARRGVEVEREARAVTVHDLELVTLDGPDARFRVHCSKGTYVRALAADLGGALGCGAHLTSLRRTASGRFAIADAVALATLTERALSLAARRARARAALVDPAAALQALPAVSVPADRVEQIRNGQKLEVAAIGLSPKAPEGPLRLLLDSGQLLAIAEVVEGRLRYARVFTYALT